LKFLRQESNEINASARTEGDGDKEEEKVPSTEVAAKPQSKADQKPTQVSLFDE
jgi:hypothetical protein